VFNLKKIYLIFIFISIFTNVKTADEKIIYKDIGKEHWAYNSVENLINKGIFSVNSEFFNGEQKVSRGEFAVYLSSALNKMDDEKASKDDLMILENLIYEFSKDLNSYGFNVDKYVGKIKEIEAKLELNKVTNEQNNIKMEILLKRIDELEKFASDKKAEKSRTDFLKDIEFSIEEGVIYGKNVKSTEDKNEYKNLYDIRFKIIGNEYEVGFRKNDKVGAANEVEFLAAGEKKAGKDLKIGFHTKGYSTRYNSYYDNVEYFNYIYTEESAKNNPFPYVEKFDSIGFYTKYQKIVTALENKRDELIIINSIDTKYLKSLSIYNIETGKTEYESVLRAGLFKDRLQFGGGYGRSNREITTGYQSETGKIEMQFINGEIKLALKGNEYSVGYERKDGTDKMYDIGYGKIRYDITDKTRITYKGEAVKLEDDNYLNNYIVIKSAVYGFDVYVNYTDIAFNKEKMNFKGSVDNIDLKSYQKNSRYRESAVRGKYKFQEKAEINIGYRMIDGKSIKNSIIYGSLGYFITDFTKVYLEYVKNSTDNIYEYSDTKRDIDGNVYNIDFDDDSGIIPNYSEGAIKAGIKIKF
jgi:hypothetical protein